MPTYRGLILKCLRWKVPLIWIKVLQTKRLEAGKSYWCLRMRQELLSEYMEMWLTTSGKRQGETHPVLAFHALSHLSQIQEALLKLSEGEPVKYTWTHVCICSWSLGCCKILIQYGVTEHEVLCTGKWKNIRTKKKTEFRSQLWWYTRTNKLNHPRTGYQNFGPPDVLDISPQKPQLAKSVVRECWRWKHMEGSKFSPAMI